MTPCEQDLHDKCFDMRTAYTTEPPQFDWICRVCGAEGRESIGTSFSSETEYERLRRLFREVGGGNE